MRECTTDPKLKKNNNFRHFKHNKIQKKTSASLLTLFPLRLFAMYSWVASTYARDSIVLSKETKDKDQFLLWYSWLIFKIKTKYLFTKQYQMILYWLVSGLTTLCLSVPLWHTQLQCQAVGNWFILGLKHFCYVPLCVTDDTEETPASQEVWLSLVWWALLCCNDLNFCF